MDRNAHDIFRDGPAEGEETDVSGNDAADEAGAVGIGPLVGGLGVAPGSTSGALAGGGIGALGSLAPADVADGSDDTERTAGLEADTDQPT